MTAECGKDYLVLAANVGSSIQDDLVLDANAVSSIL